MILDKPAWVSHGGSPIFSIDVHPGGTRFATAGSDHKVKIWNLLPVADARHELQQDTPRLLATLSDHFSPVNVARFSHNGRFLASGSDDKLVILYELRAGPGQAAFGSQEGPSQENWKHIASLRGHLNNVLDVAWSHEDRYIASGSVDNQVIVWEAGSGHKAKVLEGHESYVKGVAWDPVGVYLATQGDDRSVLIWRVQDWALMHRITDPFKGMVSMTFSLRLDWSTCGSYLAAVNSFQSPTHTAVLLERGSWKTSVSLVGHKAAVVVVRFAPNMVYRPSSGAQNGSSGKEATLLLALGSQDNKFSIWSAGEQRPLVVGAQLFKQSVVDVSWAPDGTTLLACSTDGTVAIVQLERDELGQPVPQSEVDELMKQTYGDAGVRNAVFAESATQLELEAAAKQLKPSSAHAKAALKASESTMHKATKRALDARLGPGGEEASIAAAVQPQSIQARQNAPVPATMEPASAAVPAAKGRQRNGMAAGEKRKTGANGMPPPGPKRIRPEPMNGASAPAAAAAAGPLTTPTAHQRPSTAAASPTAASRRAGISAVERPAAALSMQTVQKNLVVEVGLEEGLVDGGAAMRLLEVANTRDRAGRLVAQVACSCGGRRLWGDQLPGQAVLAAATPRFCAVALQDGTLQVYTPGGRRQLCAMRLGACPAFLATDGQWALLAATVDDGVRIFDLQVPRKLLTASAAGLLSSAAPGTSVVAMRVVGAGLALAVLSDRSACLFQPDLGEWVSVADASFPASAFHTSLRLDATPGMRCCCTIRELSSVQREAAGAGALGSGARLAALQQGPAAQAHDSRAHLEANMAAALALRSPAEYRRWLLTYARHLADAADEVRLRELCEELLGPPRSGGGAGMGPATSPPAATETDADGVGWQPTVLGLDKRRLLQEEVLRDISRNRANQRLVTEFAEMLTELRQPPPPAPAAPALR